MCCALLFCFQPDEIRAGNPIEEMLTYSHLAWCRSHDWGRNATLFNGVITLTDLDGEVQKFDEFEALLAWAGY